MMVIPILGRRGSALCRQRDLDEHLQYLGEQLLLLEHCRKGFLLRPLANFSVLDPLLIAFNLHKTKLIHIYA